MTLNRKLCFPLNRGFAALLLLAISVSIQSGSVRAQDRSTISQPEALTLPIAVEIALRTNPLTRASAFGRDLAEAQISEARATRLPQVQLSETFSNGNNPVFVFGSLLEQARFSQQNFSLPLLNNPDPLTNFRFGVTVKAPLFDQWQASTRIKRAHLARQQADAQTTQTEQQVRFETLRAFYGLLLASERKRVASDAIRLAEADVKLARDRFDAGTAVASDLLAAEVQLSESLQHLIETEGNIISAEATLNTALGLPLNLPRNVEGDLRERRFEVSSQDDLIKLALESRPDLLRSALTVTSSEVHAQGARNEYLPRVDLFATAGASRYNWIDGSTDYILGASITFNLFDAGRNARIAQARSAANLASSEQQHLTNQISLEVVRAYQHYVSARERLKVAERMIGQADEALRIVKDRYQEGLTTMTEVLRAETTLIRSRLTLLSIRYDYYVGYASVKLATGRLTDVQPFVS